MSSLPMPITPPPSPPRSRPNDARGARTLQLFRKWKAGDESAGDTLFRDLRKRLQTYFRHQPPHVLNDLVQETLVACVVARKTLRREDALLSYVFVVARRVLLRQIRHRMRTTVPFDEEPVDDHRPTPDLVLEAHRLLGDRLTPCARLAVQYHVEGHRGVELARALKISRSSVRRRVRRGLDELRRSASRPCVRSRATNGDSSRATTPV